MDLSGVPHRPDISCFSPCKWPLCVFRGGYNIIQAITFRMPLFLSPVNFSQPGFPAEDSLPDSPPAAKLRVRGGGRGAGDARRRGPHYRGPRVGPGHRQRPPPQWSIFFLEWCRVSVLFAGCGRLKDGVFFLVEGAKSRFSTKGRIQSLWHFSAPFSTRKKESVPSMRKYSHLQ